MTLQAVSPPVAMQILLWVLYAAALVTLFVINQRARRKGDEKMEERVRMAGLSLFALFFVSRFFTGSTTTSIVSGWFILVIVGTIIREARRH